MTSYDDLRRIMSIHDDEYNNLCRVATSYDGACYELLRAMARLWRIMTTITTNYAELLRRILRVMTSYDEL